MRRRLARDRSTGSDSIDLRYDYTAIGDAVNPAARQCDPVADDLNLISKQAYNKVDHEINDEALGALTLNGFPVQTMTYNVS